MPFRFNQADTAPMRPGYSGVASSLFQGLGGMLGTVKEEMTAEQMAEAERVKREMQAKRDAMDWALKGSQIKASNAETQKNLKYQEVMGQQLAQGKAEFDSKQAEGERKRVDEDAKQKLWESVGPQIQEDVDNGMTWSNSVTRHLTGSGLLRTKEGIDLLNEAYKRDLLVSGVKKAEIAAGAKIESAKINGDKREKAREAAKSAKVAGVIPREYDTWDRETKRKFLDNAIATVDSAQTAKIGPTPTGKRSSVSTGPSETTLNNLRLLKAALDANP